MGIHLSGRVLTPHEKLCAAVRIAESDLRQVIDAEETLKKLTRAQAQAKLKAASEALEAYSLTKVQS